MFQDTASLIANVGIMVVISALFIILFWRQYNQMQKLLGKYIDGLENNKKDSIQIHESGISKRMEITERVINSIKELAHRIGAKRSFIFELHNSVNNLAGLPFSKFSMTYEFFEPGQKPAMHEYQNLPASSLTSVVFKLYHTNFFLINNGSEVLAEYQQIAWYMLHREAQSLIFLPLKDSNNSIFGLIGFDFADLQDCEEWCQDKIEKVFYQDVSRIAGYLDFKRVTNAHALQLEKK